GKGEGLKGEELLLELEKVAREGIEGGWVKAWGEIGIDFDRLGLVKKEVQERWFERQLEVATRLPLPLFLHSRAAHSSFLRILHPYLPHLPRRGLVHSFTGTIAEMQELVKLGFHIGINGCSLKTEDNLEVVKQVPLDKLHLETDGPWCEIRPSHAGFKLLEDALGVERGVDGKGAGEKKANGVKVGKGLEERWKKVKKEKWSNDCMVKGRNEPCEIWKVARVVARVKGLSVEEVTGAAWRNSMGMFGFGVVEGG
ncbi:MAG: hypothetical protein Q9169_008583, partial [Polycauliona sp. 2 TL-2023]